MPLKFECRCGTRLVVSTRFAGRRVKCPKCAESIEVPLAHDVEPPPQPEVPARSLAETIRLKARESEQPAAAKSSDANPNLPMKSGTTKSQPNVVAPLHAKVTERSSRDEAEPEAPPVQRLTVQAPVTPPVASPPRIDKPELSSQPTGQDPPPPVHSTAPPPLPAPPRELPKSEPPIARAIPIDAKTKTPATKTPATKELATKELETKKLAAPASDAQADVPKLTEPNTPQPRAPEPKASQPKTLEPKVRDTLAPNEVPPKQKTPVQETPEHKTPDKISSDNKVSHTSQLSRARDDTERADAKQTIAQQSVANVRGTTHSTAKDSTAKDSTAKDSTAKDSTAKDSTAKDSTAKDSTAKDSHKKNPETNQQSASDFNARDSDAKRTSVEARDRRVPKDESDHRPAFKDHGLEQQEPTLPKSDTSPGSPLNEPRAAEAAADRSQTKQDVSRPPARPTPPPSAKATVPQTAPANAQEPSPPPQSLSAPNPAVATPARDPLSQVTPRPPAPTTSLAASPDLSTGRLPGYQPTDDQVAIVRAIGISLAVVATISVIPAVIDIVEHLRAEASLGVARWAYLVLMLAMLQSAYAAYVYQLPDWSTVWVVTIVTLVIATGYALMLGLTFITHADAWLVNTLDLGDVFRGGRASVWCFVMLCLTSLVSYFCGRISVRWRDELIPS